MLLEFIKCNANALDKKRAFKESVLKFRQMYAINLNSATKMLELHLGEKE